MKLDDSFQTEKVWAFDLGKGSIGEAVRHGKVFKHKASLLIPHDFAETKTAGRRRRFYRTRLAHKAREAWLAEVMEKVGIQPLKGRQIIRDSKTNKWKVIPGDKRLEQEFAPAGEQTCYTSCLLRIKLLKGEKLESWQIYKALHSAIQRRGYDPNIPWKARSKRCASQEDQDEGKTLTRMTEFETELETMAAGNKEYRWPCYFDAWKMGLWDPAMPNLLKDKQDHSALSTRNQIIPRHLVEAEVRALIEAASKFYPALKSKANYILFGPAEKPYASFYSEERKKHNLREGGNSDWKGVVGQKIPRFDNRIIERCVLIPRLNACKAGVKVDSATKLPRAETLLPSEVTFLMKLKNMRFQQGGQVRGLSALEIGQIFNDPKRKKFGLTATQWKKWCEKFDGVPMPGQNEEVSEPKASGRSKFSRPALQIIKRLIFSGDEPEVAYANEVKLLNGNTDPKKGLVEEDLKFLKKMGTTWEGIYIPNQKLEAITQTFQDPKTAIRKLIGSQNDPIVRHRLTVFADRLDYLAQQFGEPDFVVLEFVREDFMGKQAKLDYMTFQRDRANERAKAKKEAEEAGCTEGSAGLRMELLKAQGGICLYTGMALAPTMLDQYCIDHVVPRTKGGPDSAMNYVLTTRKANEDKGDQTPYEWLSKTDGWSAYVERVKKQGTSLRNKKVQLLTSPEAETLVQKYTALAETAWISKLAQTIISLRFGWPGGIKNERRRVLIVSGGLTGRFRRKYKLNSLLNPGSQSEEEAEKKNRNDDRHHALDAMVISFLPTWARNEKFAGFFKFPEGIDRTFFGKEILNIIPQNVCFNKPTLAETIYGLRKYSNEDVIVLRVDLLDLGFKSISPSKKEFNRDYCKKKAEAILDEKIKKTVLEFLKTDPDENCWRDFCRNFQVPTKIGKAGPRVDLVTISVGNPLEYKDLSKDKTGAFRKALKEHKGQLVYLDAKKNPKVRPVYPFEATGKVKADLLIENPNIEIIGFYQSKCLVDLTAEVVQNQAKLPPGRYSLNTILADGRAVLTNSSGEKSPPISLKRLLEAGFKRVK